MRKMRSGLARGGSWRGRPLMLSGASAPAGSAGPPPPHPVARLYNVPRSPLSAREQGVLRLLLTNLSEKEIADRLGLTRGTTHCYVTEILRKFGVSGRAGLTALWLGQQPGAPARPAD